MQNSKLSLFLGLLLSCMFVIKLNAFPSAMTKETQDFSILQGVDAENYSSIIEKLKALEIHYKTGEGKIFVVSEELDTVIDSLRFSGILIYQEVYFVPQNGKFMTDDDFIPADFPNKTIKMAVIDNVDMIDEAESILQRWKMFYQKYQGMIAIPVENKAKVIQKFKACGLLSFRKGEIRFVLSTTPVLADTAELKKWQQQQKKKTEENAVKYRKEMILNEILKEEDIFEADAVFINGTWKVKVLNPQNYKWLEQQKRYIIEEIQRKLKLSSDLEKDETLLLDF